MNSFNHILELVRSELNKEDVNLKEISQELKIPTNVLIRLKTEDNFIEDNYPYSIFILKTLSKKFNIDFNINSEEDLQTLKKDRPLDTPKDEKSIKEKIISFFKMFALVFLVISFLTFSHFYPEEDLPTVSGYKFKQVINITNPYENQKNSLSNITLLARQNIWIAANIDGKERVISLKKGQKSHITFKNKIHFETIGNADSLVIVFNGKKFSFSQKVVHNIFVDSEGVFKDGYNLYKGKSS